MSEGTVTETSPVRSMTGFGRGSFPAGEGGLRISVEIATVNRKALDFALSTPREWNGLESKVAGWLAPYFQRGRVQVSILVERAGRAGEAGTPSRVLSGDTDSLLRELAAFRALAESAGIEFRPDAGFLLALAEKTRGESALPAWESVEADLLAAVLAAADATVRMRTAEGAALAQVLAAGADELETIRRTLGEAAASVVPDYRDLLLARLRKLGLEIDLTDERVLKEVAIFADRSDVSEELARLESHLVQFQTVLKEGGAVGRKLDFLCQEIHREFNTMGSKANGLAVTRGVLEAKNILERIREQVQNIE